MKGSQIVSNNSPAQPMKIDTFERLLAGEYKRIDGIVVGVRVGGSGRWRRSKGFGLN